MNYLGAVITVAAAYFCGVRLAREERKRLAALDSLISLFAFMERRMASERAPLYRIFSDFNDCFLEETGFLPLVRSRRSMHTLLWRDALELIPLEDNVRNELAYFGESLGGIPLEEQIKRMDSYGKMLRAARESTAKALPDKQKSIKTVCLLTGLMAAIILL